VCGGNGVFTLPCASPLDIQTPVHIPTFAFPIVPSNFNFISMIILKLEHGRIFIIMHLFVLYFECRSL